MMVDEDLKETLVAIRGRRPSIDRPRYSSNGDSIGPEGEARKASGTNWRHRSGYVGLPLAVEFARAGFDVTGFDVDEWKVSHINAGRSYILDVKTEDVENCVTAGKLRATTDMSKLGEMDALTSACRRRCARRKTPTCRMSCRRPSRSPNTCIRGC